MNVEVIHQLLAYKDLKIIQRKDMFNFSLDTVLLAHFAKIPKQTQRILDIGTNNLAIPLLLSQRTKCSIDGIEIQAEAVAIAKKNIALNHMENQITVVHSALQNYYPGNNHKYQLIVCNPPFFKIGSHHRVKADQKLVIARHEVEITLEEIIRHTSRLLDNQGKFAMIHRPERLVEIMVLMEKYRIEPKRLRFVHPCKGKASHMVLIEGVLRGKKGGLIVEKPLYAHEHDGNYSKEVKSYFGQNQNTTQL